MDENIMVEIKVSRSKKDIVYSVDCASDLTNEELEYYLEEIIKGLCKWKPGVCEETAHHRIGTIKNKKS